MKKIKLDLDALNVESFTTASARVGTGTVRARESADMGDTVFDNTCGHYATCDQQCAPWTRQDGCETGLGCTTENSAAPYHTCEPDTCGLTLCIYSADMNSCGIGSCTYNDRCA